MADTENQTAAVPTSRRWRLALMLLGPVLALGVGGYFYLTGGRYVGTENAYVQADKVAVSAEISGPISDVLVAENAPVEKGDILFRIDDEPFRIALDKAEARLQSVRSEIAGLKARYRQKQEELKLAQETADFAEREYHRQARLAETQVVSESRIDEVRHNWRTAKQRIAVIREEIAAIVTELDGDPDIAVERHPRFIAAKTARDMARLDLKRTRIRASFDGIAAKTPEPGQYVKAGAPVMSIVADSHVWIDANFKETALTYVKPGQPVSIHVDTYPGREWQGSVESISQATGAEFSILPPQNASGNWVKVVQRIPVRIAITPEADAPPLRAGMSTEVEIDTGRSRSLFSAFAGDTAADR